MAQQRLRYRAIIVLVCHAWLLLGLFFALISRDAARQMLTSAEQSGQQQAVTAAALAARSGRSLNLLARDIAGLIAGEQGALISVVGADNAWEADHRGTVRQLSASEQERILAELRAGQARGPQSTLIGAGARRYVQTIAAAWPADSHQDLVVRLLRPVPEIAMFAGTVRRKFVLLLLLALLTAVLMSGAVRRLTMSLRRIAAAAGRIAAGDYTGVLAMDSDDEVGAIAAALNNLREQVKLQIDAIAASKSRLEAVLLSMYEGVMVVDTQRRIVLMDKKVRDWFGIVDEPFGREMIAVIRHVEIQRLTELALRGKRRVEAREISLVREQEQKIVVQATAVLRDGKSEGAVLVFNDITKLRRLETMRQDFVANVSHELRTPVSSIKGYAETLLDGAIDNPGDAREFMMIINQEANRLAALINDLLDLSKIEAGSLTLTLTPVELSRSIARIVSQLGGQIEKKNIAVSVSEAEPVPPVPADEQKIDQVLVNLIDNAVKYTPSGGRIYIAVSRRPPMACIEITDTGIGIPEDAQERIFERFFRVDKARSRELGGTGLGLAIVKHIVQAHKGSVAVHSVLGQGSTFVVLLPLNRESSSRDDFTG